MRTWVLPLVGAVVCSESTTLLIGFHYHLFSDPFVWWKALVNLVVFVGWGMGIELLLRRRGLKTSGTSGPPGG